MLNKIITLQLLRNMADVQYRTGQITLGELQETENNLSLYLNKN